MKIRNGFVSNSSSSSFLVLIAKSEYDNIIKNINPLSQAVIEQLSEQTKFLGTDCVCYNRMNGNYNDFEWLPEDECVDRAKEISKKFDENDYEWCSDLLDDFEEAIQNSRASGKVFTHSSDF